MRIFRLIIQYRLIITILLALIGIGLIAYYVSCDTACSYLKGDIFGIDLKYVGMAYILSIMVLAFFKQPDLLRLLIASGIGVEIFLVSFQFQKNVFCPYCLSLGVIVFLMYLTNYERSGMQLKWYSKLIHVFGNAKIPFAADMKIPLLGMILIGYVFVSLTFNGTATPAYAGNPAAVPSYGKGAWELIIFTDYFCPPCQAVEKELEPEIQRLLTRGDVKITFADFPGHKSTALYAKYFLCAAAAEKGYANAMKARKILFSLARNKNIDQEKILAAQLKSSGIDLKLIDPKPVYEEWTAMIKRYDVTQTPTCLLRYSSTYTKKYSDGEQISKVLIPELHKRFPLEKK